MLPKDAPEKGETAPAAPADAVPQAKADGAPPADAPVAQPAETKKATQEMTALATADDGAASEPERQIEGQTATAASAEASAPQAETPSSAVLPMESASAAVAAAEAAAPVVTETPPPTGTTKPISEPIASAEAEPVGPTEPAALEAPAATAAALVEPAPAASATTTPVDAADAASSPPALAAPALPLADAPAATSAPPSPPPATTVAPPGPGVSPFVSPIPPVPSAPAQSSLNGEIAEAEVRTCPLCGSRIREGELACSFCGHVLTQQGKTAKFDEETEVSGKKSWPTGEVLTTEQKPITFEIEGKQLTLMIAESITVGRNSDIPGDALPDVDLGPYGASEMGVSRRHIRIRRKGILLYVADLNSTNGTLLNGRKLIPEGERLIRSGDELRLGHLKIRVKF